MAPNIQVTVHDQNNEAELNIHPNVDTHFCERRRQLKNCVEN